jgi:hypothetical protein
MKKQLAVVFGIAMLLTVSVAASIDLSQTADAAKAKGTTTQKYDSATKSLVCGDKLCSETDSKPKMKDSDSMTPSSMNMHVMIERMDKIHEKHQQHIIQSWESMTIDKQSMMYQKMQKMMEKTESMEMSEYIKMMSNMDKKDHDKNMHDDSDEKHKTAQHLAKQHLETFDELDFDVFTNQEWDRLYESHSQEIAVHWPDGRTTVDI